MYKAYKNRGNFKTLHKSRKTNTLNTVLEWQQWTEIEIFGNCDLLRTRLSRQWWTWIVRWIWGSHGNLGSWFCPSQTWPVFTWHRHIQANMQADRQTHTHTGRQTEIQLDRLHRAAGSRCTQLCIIVARLSVTARKLVWRKLVFSLFETSKV